jgi:hypothetical protein
MKKAITLIELLVVIATITLLMGAFLQALGNARGNAHHNQCMNNLKKLVDSAALWANDHNDWAIAGDWFKEPGQSGTESSLLPYIISKHNRHDMPHKRHDLLPQKKQDTSLICPASRDIKFFNSNPDLTVDKRRYTYAVNAYMTLNMAPYGEGSPGMLGSTHPDGLYGPNDFNWTVHGVTTMAAIRKPAETVFFIDHEYYLAFSWSFDPTKPYSSFPQDYRFKTRWHNIQPGDDYGIGMIGWVDGHCSPEPSDFTSTYFDPASNINKPRWKYYFYDH